MQCAVSAKQLAGLAMGFNLWLAKLSALHLYLPSKALVSPQLIDVGAIGVVSLGTHTL